MKRIPWREMAIVALTLALGWGLRGQHGHERGAALAGALVGLSLAAVTGGARWMGAAVIGSLTFAIGGALSYGRFVNPAYHGSLGAVAGLALVGFVWGGLGGLGLGLGLAISRYRRRERITVGLGLLMVWFVVDRLMWGYLTGPEDLRTRGMMALVLLVVWVFLSAYVGLVRRDFSSLKLAWSVGIGFGIGFPLAAWIQGAGSATGIPINWWTVGEHGIGLLGGLLLAWVGLEQKASWRLPAATRPWERWLAVAWLLWLLPTWLIANNLDFWISEKALLPLTFGTWIWSLLFVALAFLIFWGWLEMRRGRIFVTSWMPRHLRKIFLLLVWISTLIACSKTWVAGIWTPTPIGFLLLAALVTVLTWKGNIQI